MARSTDLYGASNLTQPVKDISASGFVGIGNMGSITLGFFVGTHNEHEDLVYLTLHHHNHILVRRHVPYEQSLASNARWSEFI